MASTQTYEGQPSLESIWAILRETVEINERTARRQEDMARQLEEHKKQQEEERKEFDHRMEEERKEFDHRMEESERKIDRHWEKYNKRFGEFSNRFGEIVEYMVAPNLLEKFRELGFVFTESSNTRKFKSPEGKYLFEVDVMLENGDKALLTETKTKPTTEDVNDHIARLEKMRQYASARGDKRAFMGAVAGVVMNAQVREYILGKGLFAVEPSGETFTITAPGSPREW